MTRTQHCQCGTDTYHVKFDLSTGAAWAECTACGRPTKTLGDGLEKQAEWRAEHR